MQYLACFGAGGDGIEFEILQKNCIIEAFGNAKTSWNNNYNSFVSQKVATPIGSGISHLLHETLGVKNIPSKVETLDDDNVDGRKPEEVNEVLRLQVIFKPMSDEEVVDVQSLWKEMPRRTIYYTFLIKNLVTNETDDFREEYKEANLDVKGVKEEAEEVSLEKKNKVDKELEDY
ncbi:hypothetical protein ACFE04_019549 [Oxalis oulophora]